MRIFKYDGALRKYAERSNYTHFSRELWEESRLAWQSSVFLTKSYNDAKAMAEVMALARTRDMRLRAMPVPQSVFAAEDRLRVARNP